MSLSTHLAYNFWLSYIGGGGGGGGGGWVGGVCGAMSPFPKQIFFMNALLVINIFELPVWFMNRTFSRDSIFNTTSTYNLW